MSEQVKVPPLFLRFMDAVNLSGHDSIMLRAHATAPDRTCVELDVRLHDTHPHLTYIIGVVDENATADHPKTGEALHDVKAVKAMMGFGDEVPQMDDYYLGPFNEEAALEIIAAADMTAARLDVEDRAETLRYELAQLEKTAATYGALSSKHGAIVGKLGELDRAVKREERKGMLRVIPGGKAAAP